MASAEHDAGSSGCGLLLKRGPGPFVAVAGRQRRRRDALHRGERLAGTVAGFRRAVDDGAAVAVIAHHGLRPLHELGLGQRAHRHHAALGVAHVDALDIVLALAKRRVGLDIDLPGAAEHIEVVDVETAQRRLQRVEDIADLDAEHLGLVAIDIEIDLRRVGGIGAEHAGELGLAGWPRPASRACTAATSVGGWPCRASSTYWKPPVLPRPRIGGRLNGKAMAPWIAAKLRPQPRDDRVGALRRIGAHLVGLEPDDEERLVRRRDIVDEVQPDHRQHAFDAGDRPDDVLDLLDHRLGAVDRSAFRQPQSGEDRALILVRQKALRRDC